MRKPSPIRRVLDGFGRALLGIAIALGSVIGVSFWAEVVFERTFDGVVSSSVVLQNGAFVVARDDLTGWPPIIDASAWKPQWRKGGDGLEVSIPVWPLPAFLAVFGIVARMLGARARDSAAATRGWAMRRVAFGLASLGIGMLAVIVLSFVTLGGIGTLRSDRAGTRQLRITHGVVLFSRAKATGPLFAAGVVTPASVSAWSAWYTNGGSLFSLGAPVWPAPVVVLGAAAWCWRRSGRAGRLVAAGRCGACGYPRGSADGVCPECGRAERVADAIVNADHRVRAPVQGP